MSAQAFAVAALAAAVVSFGFAMWAATPGDSWRTTASVIAAGACVTSLAFALGLS